MTRLIQPTNHSPASQPASQPASEAGSQAASQPFFVFFHEAELLHLRAWCAGLQLAISFMLCDEAELVHLLPAWCGGLEVAVRGSLQVGQEYPWPSFWLFPELPVNTSHHLN